MILDGKTGRFPGLLVDESTGKPIRFACWANTDTGEYEAYVTTPDGQHLAEPPRKYRGRAGRLHFVAGRVHNPDAPAAVDNRAASEEIAELRRKITPKLLIPGDYCEEKGCHQLSEWYVSLVQKLQPVRQPDGVLQGRQHITRVFSLCSKHYRLPVITSIRGVEAEAKLELVRPQ
jgi:hypothetical protein